jgi:hypothetical protein
VADRERGRDAGFESAAVGDDVEVGVSQAGGTIVRSGVWATNASVKEVD